MLQTFEGREKEDEWIEDLLRRKAKSASDTAVFLRTNREASRYAEICRNAGIECDMKEALYNDFDEYYYVARFVFFSYNYICRKHYALWRMWLWNLREILRNR